MILIWRTIWDFPYRMIECVYQSGIGEPQERIRCQTLPLYGTIKRRGDPQTLSSRLCKDDTYDYRPYFTYYITVVQIVVCLGYLLIFGIGTDFESFHTGVVEKAGEVLTPSLSSAHIVIWEQNNYWIGPRFADLVHMGAKYTPCMRRDKQIQARIDDERRLESETGCCIGFDGCYQTSECPRQFASLMRFTNTTFVDNPVRAVCGQDPRYCITPRSIHPFEWSFNISKWPICEMKTPFIPTKATHMHCEIVGRPCCIQMHGQCRITTKEYCEFVRGYYYENATLCSQVDCLSNICGKSYFWKYYQVYRFFLPLFVHAGIIRLLITVTLQFTIMRRFEICIGWSRLSTIYIFSGVGGYLASATFEPFMPELGPAGSQGGVLGALFIDVIYNWKYIKEPTVVLLVHSMLAMFLLLTGFLPFIDNWAQIFGFIFGMLWAAVLIPYFGTSHTKRNIFIAICIMALVFLYTILILLFFGGFDISPSWSLLNCPFPGRVCDHQGSQLKSWLPI